MMTKEQKPLPGLRFPEFDGDWELHKLGEFINQRKDVASSDLPLYSLTIESGIVPKSKRYERSFLVKSEDGAYKRMKPKDFAYNPMNLRWGALACHHGHEEVAVSKYYDVFSVNEKSAPEYLEPFLTSYKMVKFYDRMSAGTLDEKKRVHYLDFIHFKKLFPTLPEQQKIAGFLTAVDGRIQQLTQKKALLEDYKKGVMQQLFIQAIRFKDNHGNDFPDWEEKRYDAVYSFKNTNSYSRDLLSYEDGEVRNIHYGDIHTKFKSNFVLENERVPFIKPEVELKRISEDCYCREGDLVIADASEDYNDVGKCIEIRDLGGERTLAGLHTFIARPKKIAMAPSFGGYLMQAREVRLKIMTIAQGTKVLGISKTQLCKVLLPIPSPDEQTKIADFLSAIDRKIESVATQITETQSFERGLLQQMFI
jgi:type I restriction enzyme S subunit